MVRFYHGFATAMFVPVAEASIAELYPTKRGERISLFNSASAVGRAIAPFLGASILFASGQNYHALYIAVGAAGVTAFVTALLFLADNRNPIQTPKEQRTRRMFEGWLTLIRDRAVLGVSFVQAIQYYVFGTVEFFLVGYLTDIVGLDIFLVGIITGSQIVALMVSRPIIGRISDHIGRTKPIVAGAAASCLLVAAFPFATAFPLLLLLSIGFGISFAAVLSSTSPLISELVPASLVGASLGFLATMMDVGQTLGPIISGVIFATSLGYLGLFTSLSVVLVISIAVFLFLKNRNGS